MLVVQPYATAGAVGLRVTPVRQTFDPVELAPDAVERLEAGRHAAAGACVGTGWFFI